MKKHLIFCILLNFFLTPPVLADIDIFHKGNSNELILFVHGLYGSAEETFKNDKSKISWPLLISRDRKKMASNTSMSEYSVGLVHYPSSRSDSLSIEQISTRLTTDLEDEAIFSTFNNVYIVTHSLGGLVVKELLLKLYLDKPKAINKVKAVFLIGVPSQGAPAVSYIKTIPEFFRGRVMSDLSTIDVNTYLQSLESRWQSILRNRNIDSFKVFCAYETKSVMGLFVVPQAYTSTICDETPRAENTNHIDIVKPEDTSASIYKWVRGRITSLSIKKMKLNKSMLDSRIVSDPTAKNESTSTSNALHKGVGNIRQKNKGCSSLNLQTKAVHFGQGDIVQLVSKDCNSDLKAFHYSNGNIEQNIE